MTTRDNPDEYNGWTNYETWAVKLWIDNDQGSQDYWLSEAKVLPPYELGQALEEMHSDQGLEGLGNTVFADLMGHALNRVDWYEIARTLVEEAREINP
jgi:hypothetical protein